MGVPLAVSKRSLAPPSHRQRKDESRAAFVIFDIGFWSKQSRNDASIKAIELGFTPIIYYIYAPDDTLKERIAKRPETIAEHNIKHFDEIKKHFEEPDKSENYIKINTEEK